MDKTDGEQRAIAHTGGAGHRLALLRRLGWPAGQSVNADGMGLLHLHCTRG